MMSDRKRLLLTSNGPKSAIPNNLKLQTDAIEEEKDSFVASESLNSVI